MISKTEALIRLDVDPFKFCRACEALGNIDPDAEAYSNHDLLMIKYQIDGGTEQEPWATSFHNPEDEIRSEEAAKILGVTMDTFRAYWAKQVRKYGRGVYSRKSVEELARSKGPHTKLEPGAPVRVHRIQVDRREDGGASITIFVEGNQVDVVQRIAAALTS